ncbi:catalase-like [Diaphorina citri]|uniref:Catalase-like n=1 Tax=Diaphorina citri TaxID=121845 RepID=A0A1S3DSG7_DIACI|nr:catalase-like [Diaphorina citri]
MFWNILSQDERDRLVDNIVGALKNANDLIQDRAVGNFSQVNAEFGQKLRAGLKAARSKSNL